MDMKSKTKLCLFSFFLVGVVITATAPSLTEGFIFGGSQDGEDIKISDFPSGFIFGAATSAYQIEGAILEDGKALSNWDVFNHDQENVENGDIADDHYHLYSKDIEMLHSLGIKAYRFSISWARVLPRGRFGDINLKGIMFYNNIIDNLLLKGIEPFVTIHHNDWPQELEDRYGSWLSPLMQEDFVHYAEICFKSFGDRVKYWIPINEPNIISLMGYERGIYPPARCSEPFGNCSTGNSDVEPLITTHNMLLAHGKAVKLYRDHFQPTQGGSIGMVTHCFAYRPVTDDETGREAAKRAFAFNVAWIYDPVIFGDYPPEMRQYLGSQLPHFSPVEKNCILGGDRPILGYVNTTGERDGVPIGEPTAMPRFFVVPKGMEEIVNYVKNRYNNKPMFVTENGYSSLRKQGEQLNDVLHDVKRVEFHKAYLSSLAKAIRDGADVRGYFVWTLMDNYEWANGYSSRFGIYDVDEQTMNRTPKLSAKWYKGFLEYNSLNSKETSTDRRTNEYETFGISELVDKKAVI